MTKHLLTSEWITLFSRCNKLIVGFSGGLDSTVLLHVLASIPALRPKLLAVHINHGISEHSAFWQKHCEQFCRDAGIEFFAQSVQFNRSANLEEGARVARYHVFYSLLKENECLILGHHLNDQAETVLLQLVRGAGVDGLAAMQELICLESGALARPFLAYSREQLELYAVAQQLTWIDDESNQDIKHSRNFLRNEVMPLLAKRWSGVVANIARAASHCQQAKNNLDDLAFDDCQDLLQPDNYLFIEPLKSLSIDRITNVLRVWLKKNQIQMPSTLTFQRLIHEVIFASSDAMPKVSWHDIQIRRYQDRIFLDNNAEIPVPDEVEWTDFPEPLAFPEYKLVAQRVEQGILIPEHMKITVKFRKGGEEIFWHGQTKQLKNLFQEWRIPPWKRDRIPLIYFDNQLAAVAGFAVSDLFFTKNESQAWQITLASI